MRPAHRTTGANPSHGKLCCAPCESLSRSFSPVFLFPFPFSLAIPSPLAPLSPQPLQSLTASAASLADAVMLSRCLYIPLCSRQHCKGNGGVVGWPENAACNALHAAPLASRLAQARARYLEQANIGRPHDPARSERLDQTGASLSYQGTVRVGVVGVGVDHHPSVPLGGRTPSRSRGTGRGAREARAGRTGLETDCPGTQGGVDRHGRGVVSHVAIRTPDRATSRVRLSPIHPRLGPAACSLAAAAYAGVACDAPASVDAPALPFVLVVAAWPWMLGNLAVRTSLPQHEMEASITSSPPPPPRSGPRPGPRSACPSELPLRLGKTGQVNMGAAWSHRTCARAWR